jgi:formylglycine-generating enzyme required for sulfatase activity
MDPIRRSIHPRIQHRRDLASSLNFPADLRETFVKFTRPGRAVLAALQRRIVVIPVRVGREGQLPPLPVAGDLPSDIRDLVLYQKHDVTHERFGRDIAELVEAIRVVRRLNRPKSAMQQVHWGWIGAVAALMLTIGYVGINNIPAWWRGSSAGISDPNATQIAMNEAKRRADEAATAEEDRKRAEEAMRRAEAAKAEEDRKRAEEAKRRADEAAKAEEDRKRAEAEAKRRADEEAKAKTDRSQAEAETKRRADEQAKAEADRRQAEAKRRADEQALRDPALSITPASGQSFRDRLANGQPCLFCPEMVVAPARTFTMGSPPRESGRYTDEEQVRVTIKEPFAVGKFAVTFDQWDACVAEGGCNRYKPDDQGWGRGNRPVINVSWDEATAYAEWLSRKTGKTYRLLSETEREYVTRAGTTTPFWWGSSITTKQANYDGNYTYGGTVIVLPLSPIVSAKGEFRQRTVSVDSFEANPWGLFNVHGNAWEWTEDCWNETNQNNPGDGSARSTGDCSRRVVRGGSCYNFPQVLRAASRSWYTTGVRSRNVGFRLARTLNP